MLHLEEERRRSLYDTDGWRDRIADVYLDNLKKADKISRANGSRFMAFFQPLVYFKKPCTQKEARYRLAKHENHFAYLKTAILSGAPAPGGSQELLFVDLSRMFEGEHETVFIDEVHVTQPARQVIARQIFKHVMKNIFSPSKPPLGVR